MRRGSGAGGNRLNYPLSAAIGYSAAPGKPLRVVAAFLASYKLARGKPSILRSPQHRGEPGFSLTAQPQSVTLIPDGNGVSRRRVLVLAGAPYSSMLCSKSQPRRPTRA
jgi:hypothetical protein